MFRIGDFSKLNRVTVKALRHYDALGLLRPASVDPESGYRYYSAAQVPRLTRIIALKDAGLSLEEIGAILSEELPESEIAGILKLRKAQLGEQVKTGQEMLSRLESLLRMTETENGMSGYDILVKEIPAMKVASLRGVVDNYSAQGSLWGELCGYLGQAGAKYAGPFITICHDTEYKESDVDLEVIAPLAGDVPGSGRIEVKELPAISKAATTVHSGPYSGLKGAYEALMKWIADNGYVIAGPDREIFIKGYGESDNEEEFVTEIQLPIQQA